ncbi:type IV toxin-antitoxin system AbiEi family antitoxin domain-containing protein [Nocardioides pinisoli]|uniref:Type IV toxin-antitoxin system AbiEi family antitoxin domain-containing protein n=1 Tax=Nocardioides pinisoli TaxID=2950279 RepID=A0ABT1KXH9_9ACTN|nr:type IV toxin-antitoxin system AbiEi family antitoxin domain-containing protein [Nocardioides pinisoli]MCP3421311.1 type IV toxin-antitoxin system AbiEi family antitoxin domain-containing protein [Nocardioides pinisoli]
MYLPAIALVEAQHGLITARQLGSAGLGPNDVHRLVAAGRLLRLRRGVYADGEAWSALDPFRGQPVLRVRAAALALRCGPYAFSHDSAAVVLDMGVPDPRQALVHVSRPKVHGDAVRAGVKHHLAPFRPEDVTTVDGLGVLSRARTALDMAREHGRAYGLAACDAALRAGARRADLEDALSRMPSWPHHRCMRWCIDHAEAGAESYLESLARDFVLELGIGRPSVQFGLSDGHTTAFADIRVGRHLFEADGLLKYDADNPSGVVPEVVLVDEKRRQDFLLGFKLGMSRLTYVDLFSGRRSALARAAREYADTCARFGTSIDDLAPYVVTRRLP